MGRGEGKFNCKAEKKTNDISGGTTRVTVQDNERLIVKHSRHQRTLHAVRQPPLQWGWTVIWSDLTSMSKFYGLLGSRIESNWKKKTADRQHTVTIRI